MATAVQTKTESATPNPRARLVLASLVGAVFVLAGIAVAAYLVPQYWKEFVSPTLGQAGSFVDAALRVVAQLVAAGVVIYAGTRLAGSNPPRGLRGGIFLVISGLIAIFFVVRAVGLNIEESLVGRPITLGVLVVLLVLFYRFLMSDRGQAWMHGIEEQGWLHTFHYKKTQGVKARRYTLLGILRVGGSGVYSLFRHESLGVGDWTMRIPFTGDPGVIITALTDIQYAVPVLLAALVFWFAWRAVNMPTFADFLVATEAEMNKVSWSSRKRLVQDTIVVLVTCVILTAFLLIVDLFWGWLLSQSWIGVLPPKSAQTSTVDPVQGKKAEW